MKYDMIPRDVVSRVMDTFYGHSCCINNAYKAFRKDGDIDDSDRDRFVGRFFKKYVGRFICFMDKEIIASTYNGYVCSTDPVSVYRAGRKGDICNVVEPLFRIKKRYLCIYGFYAVNEMYGRGYVEMKCIDTFGDRFNVRLDVNNLNNMQFREITKSEFISVSQLFADDREDVPFKVTRYLDYDEMKSRKLKGGTLVTETIEVMAKDIEEASKKVTNVHTVVPVN